MKRVLLALVVGGLLIGAPLAYATVSDPVTNDNKPATVTEMKISNPVSGSQVTWSEFTALLSDKIAGLDSQTKNIFDNNQVLTYEQAAKGIAAVLQQEGINVDPFGKEDETVAILYKLGLTSTLPDKNDAVLTKQAAEEIAAHLPAVLNLKPTDKNIYGVSYTLTPLGKQQYNLQLMWGRKSSSGYSIEITDTLMIGNTLYVGYQTNEPKEGCAYLTVITHPSDAVIIKAQDMPQKVVLINENN